MRRRGWKRAAGLAGLAIGLAGCSEGFDFQVANPCDHDVKVETSTMDIFPNPPETAADLEGEVLETYTAPARGVVEVNDFLGGPFDDEDELFFLVRAADLLDIVTVGHIKANDKIYVLPDTACVAD